jgi:hypothetical protein
MCHAFVRALTLPLLSAWLTLCPAVDGASLNDRPGVQTVSSGCVVFSPNEFGFPQSYRIQPGQVVRYRYLSPTNIPGPALLWLPGERAVRQVETLILDPDCTIAVPL